MSQRLALRARFHELSAELYELRTKIIDAEVAALDAHLLGDEALKHEAAFKLDYLHDVAGLVELELDGVERRLKALDTRRAFRLSLRAAALRRRVERNDNRLVLLANERRTAIFYHGWDSNQIKYVEAEYERSARWAWHRNQELRATCLGLGFFAA